MARRPFGQVRLFREGFDVLISPHGSQLVNMLFAPPACVFIEVVAMHNGTRARVHGSGGVPERRNQPEPCMDPEG